MKKYIAICASFVLFFVLFASIHIAIPAQAGGGGGHSGGHHGGGHSSGGHSSGGHMGGGHSGGGHYSSGHMGGGKHMSGGGGHHFSGGGKIVNSFNKTINKTTISKSSYKSITKINDSSNHSVDNSVKGGTTVLVAVVPITVNKSGGCGDNCGEDECGEDDCGRTRHVGWHQSVRPRQGCNQYNGECYK